MSHRDHASFPHSEPQPHEGLRALQAALARPDLVLAAVTLFRPVLLRAAAALVDAALASAPGAPALPGPELAVSLIAVLELAPHTEGIVLRYFQHAPAPFEYLLQQQSAALPVPAAQLARASLRGLQLSTQLDALWHWTTALGLLRHADPEVRWCAVEATALAFRLGDAAKTQVAARVLAQAEALAAALAWQNERARLAVEAAAVYVGGGDAWDGEDAGQAEGKGPRGMEVDAGQQRQQKRNQQATAEAETGQRKRKFGTMSGGGSAAASSDSDGSSHGDGGGGGRLPAASGYVDVCGLELPRCQAAEPAAPARQHALVHTPTVDRNLESLALGLCLGSPLLVEGPPGSGKSALIEHVADLTGNAAGMVRIHLDDQMDSKSLMGAYICTARPGEFVWQPGPLTQAVAQGRWVLIEDINLAPAEVLAALVPLLERRMLSIAARAETVHAAPGFQLIATVTSAPGGTAAGAYGSSQAVKNLLGGLLHYVQVVPPSPAEQQRILAALHPAVRPLVPHIMRSLDLVKAAYSQQQQQLGAGQHALPEAVAAAFAAASAEGGGMAGGRPGGLGGVGRHFSIRDALKLCRRVASVHSSLLQRSLKPAQAAEYRASVAAVPLAVRQAAFTEAADCFAALLSRREAAAWLLAALAALWALPPAEAVGRYVTTDKPAVQLGETDLVVGRVALPLVDSGAAAAATQQLLAAAAGGGGRGGAGSGAARFAPTGHALRHMERIAVAVSQGEPMLLVGETGTGKTTTVQQIARQVGARLVVLNLSQQTDSSDLLGGFRPVQPADAVLPLLDRFADMVRRTWWRGNNDEFLGRCARLAAKKRWGQLVKAFRTAVDKMEASATAAGAASGEAAPAAAAATDDAAADAGGASSKKARKHKGGKKGGSGAGGAVALALRQEWAAFATDVAAAEGGFAFAFVEGALVKAVREGAWLLLDEINLAPAEALERIAGLLEDERGSLVIAERGDATSVPRHPSFRLFAAMNPATDAGKRDLPAPLRNRFTEVWVGEPPQREDLAAIAARFLPGTGPAVDSVVDFYVAAKAEAEATLQDGAGHKPAYNLRTLCRALEYAAAAAPVYGLQRGLWDGFAMSFLTQLDPGSAPRLEALMQAHLLGPGVSPASLMHAPPQAPGPGHVLFDHFWVEAGPRPLPGSGAEDGTGGTFVLTPAVMQHLRNLARAGPTSSGKTSLVAYLAAQTGHTFVRINNHEQTDLQEYLGSYVSDESGRLVFREGLLRSTGAEGGRGGRGPGPGGASSAGGRAGWLLDDNHELYVPELQETIKPHPHFMLFATQNPPGIYAGRKTLSRAFRSRFLELHVEDIPDDELGTILEKRCAIAPSYAAKLVTVMRELQRRRAGSNVFAGRHGFITPRDLFRWAGRGAVGYQQLAEDGFAVLGERLRSAEEREMVREVLQKVLNVKLDMEAAYERNGDVPVHQLRASLEAAAQAEALAPTASDAAPSGSAATAASGGSHSVSDVAALQTALGGVVWTQSMRRMYCLLERCLEHAEPALLCGETGTGKTTVCQMAAFVRDQRLHIINCNQHTEVSDFLGGFRPNRRRERALLQVQQCVTSINACPLLGADAPDGQPPLPPPATPSAPDLAAAMAAAKQLLAAARERVGDAADGKQVAVLRRLETDVASLAEAVGAARAPFEWADGPLVQAMKQGDMILVDELNLAEDAVLERLNSVLEPGRSLTLAEKGGAGAELVVAHPAFRLVATMNPGEGGLSAFACRRSSLVHHILLLGNGMACVAVGTSSHACVRSSSSLCAGGDYGKKELSPALSNRFTSIWVPAIDSEEELLAILRSKARRRPARCAASHLLASIGEILDMPEQEQAEVAPRLLAFWRYFKAHTAHAARQALSVRDLLAWAHFINAAAPSIGLLPAYAHGAHLVLLDGLGLGVGLTAGASAALRDTCVAFLQSQLPPELHAAAAAAAGAETVEAAPEAPGAAAGEAVAPTAPGTPEHMEEDQLPPGRWGIAPFYVDRCGDGTPSGALRKPILLEGSPGVGKTSLVAALAGAVGQELVRINLSEQTDMMDLLGADLPVEGGAPGEFAWADGPLLHAIKAGAWVLLDELNLANQTGARGRIDLLEGLNAVLDHRAEVFIPELGATFRCPRSFRVFGAQNPLQEGGGRKGLPKSFLNRFTRVHVELLQPGDLLFIAGVLHPHIPPPTLGRMVAAICQLHHDANVARCFASAGGPWEFNLRDLLRWCELSESAVPVLGGQDAAASSGGGAASEDEAVALERAVQHFAGILFLQRLRTQADRKHAAAIFGAAWGGMPSADEESGAWSARCCPALHVSPQVVQLGWARLERQRSSKQAGSAAPEQLALLPSRLPVLESMAECMARGWMCLLVGPSGAGKTAAVRALATLCGQPLVELSLTSGTDTSDLLGGFEQVEMERKIQELANETEALVAAAAEAVLTCSQGSGSGSAMQQDLDGLLRHAMDAWDACFAANSQQTTSAAPQTPDGQHAQQVQSVRLLLEVLARLEQVAEALGEQAAENSGAGHAQQHKPQERQQEGLLAGVPAVRSAADAVGTTLSDADPACSSAGKFEWVDGVLTRAIERGQWVLLDNANLCNPTVLDRLNPLLEPNGSLFLNECGSGVAGPRIVRPHPGFRLFLALDAAHGEVSRAMRNRGIELFLLGSEGEGSADAQPGRNQAELASTQQQEAESVLGLSGIPGSVLPRAMAATHAAVAAASAARNQQAPSLRELRRWAALTAALARRGWPAEEAFSVAFEQVYGSLGAGGSGHESELAAVTEAFRHHCLVVWERDGLAHDLVLYKSGTWPLPLTAHSIASNSALATLGRDLAILVQHLGRRAASTRLAAAADHSTLALGALDREAAPGLALAATTPAALLQRLLTGSAGSSSALAVPAAVAEVVDELEAAACSLAAAQVYVERASPFHLGSYAAYAVAVVEQLQQASAAGPAASLTSQARELVRLLLCHPLTAALAAVQQQVAASVRPRDVGVRLLPDAEACGCPPPPHLAATQLTQHGSDAGSLWARAQGLAGQVVALQAAVQAAVQLQAALAGAEAAVMADAATLLQLSFWRYQHPKVAGMQQWRWAFLLAVHGNPEASRPASLALHFESLVFCWMQLGSAAGRVAEAGGVQAWEEAGRWVAAAGQMERALGLEGLAPAKPLLWKRGGRPLLPRTAGLCASYSQLLALCDASWVGGAGFGADYRDQPAALAAAGISVALLEEHQDGGQVPAADRPLVAAAAAAVVASDAQLRSALLEGLCLFVSSAILAAAPDGAALEEMPALLKQRVEERAAAAADAALAVLHTRIEQPATDSMDGPAPAATHGQPHVIPLLPSSLAEGALHQLQHVLPAELMHYPSGRELQLDVLGLSDLLLSSSQLALFSQGGLLGMLLCGLPGSTGNNNSTGAPAHLAVSLQRAAVALVDSGCRSVAEAAPLQLLSWLLDAIAREPRASSDLQRQQLLLQLSLVHEAWFRWHQALWRGAAECLPPSHATAVGPAVAQQWRSLAGPMRLHLAATTVLATGMLADAGTTIGEWAARVLQLRLAARQLRQRCCSKAADEAAVLAAEWSTARLVATSMLAAHASSIPEEASRRQLGQVVQALAGSIALHQDQQAQLLDDLAAAVAASEHPTLRALLQPLEQTLLASGADESARIADLEGQAAALQQHIDALEGRCTPRPRPPQYLALREEVARFVASFGDVQRVVGIADALAAGIGGGGAAAAAASTAATWQENASSWVDRLGRQYGEGGGYRDIVQPVQLAVQELRYGLALLQGSAAFTAPSAHASKALAPVVARLLAFPHSSSGLLARAPLSAPETQQAAAEAATAAALQRGQVASSSAEFVRAWEDIKAEEERRAAEDAELFKTKARSTEIATEEQEDEEDYQRQFPDRHATFADLAGTEGPADFSADPPEAAAPRPQGADQEEQQQAAAYSVRDLAMGEVLQDILAVHATAFVPQATPSCGAEAQPPAAAFLRAYELGVSLLRAGGLVLPAAVDDASATGHLYAACCRLRQLTQRPATAPASATAAPGAGETGQATEGVVDMQAGCIEEAVLVQAPVSALRQRLLELLQEWPEHPLLLQLAAIADRLVSLPLWEETAAKHVSLAPQLGQLGALAARWRRLELLGWRALLDRARAHVAGQATQAWFHLYRILVEGDSPPAEVAQAVEQFVQGSPLGEYEARLDLLAAFQLQLDAMASATATAGPPGAGQGELAARATRWRRLSPVLFNVRRYYAQFVGDVQRQIAAGMAVQEKLLQDFVALAKWEDRGYYALRQSTEKAQRQLHRLWRHAIQLLRDPSSGTLQAAAGAMGFADLRTKLSVPAPTATGPASQHALGRCKRAAKKAAAQAASANAAAASQLADPSAVLAAFSASKQALLAQLEQQPQAGASIIEGGKYASQLPRLSRRFAEVVGGGLASHAAAAGAEAVDELASEVISRALELRGDVAKGAKARKKKALTDFFKALAASGVSRRRSVVPSAQRGVQAWFAQGGPVLDGLLAPADPCAPQQRGSAEQQALLAAAQTVWTKADGYYFRSMARLQRLWEAAKQPHADLSAAEVEASVRSCEHLLWLTQQSRATLGAAADLHAQLAQAEGVLSVLAAGQELPPQRPCQEWYGVQRHQLARLASLARESAELLAAAAEAETLPRFKGGLAQGKQALEAAGATVQACLARLAATAELTLLLPGGGVLLLPSVAQTLEANGLDLWRAWELLQQVPPGSSAQEGLPGWQVVLSAFAEVAQQSAAQGAAVAAGKAQGTAAGRAAAAASPAQQAAGYLESAVAAALVWGQHASKPSAAGEEANGGAALRDAAARDGDEPSAPEPALEASPLPELLQQLEAQLAMDKAAAVCAHVGAALQALAAATDAGGDAADLAVALSGLAPLLGLAREALRGLAIKYLALAKGVAKLCHVTAALLAGLVQEGFCMPDGAEGEGVQDGSDGKMTEGTGLGEGDTKGAKDISNELDDQDQLLGAQQRDAQREEEQQPDEGAQQQDNAGKCRRALARVEMDDDFLGALHDVQPDEGAQSDEGEDGDEEQERLDQQMGEVGEEGEAVDERLWNEEDQKEEGKAEEQALADDKPVPVADKSQLEYAAGGDEEEEDNEQQAPSEKQGRQQQQEQAAEGQEEASEEEGEGAEYGDRPEDRAGFTQPEAPEQEFELPEDLNLDGGAEDEGEQQEEGGPEEEQQQQQGEEQQPASAEERAGEVGEDEGGGEDAEMRETGSPGREEEEQQAAEQQEQAGPAAGEAVEGEEEEQPEDGTGPDAAMRDADQHTQEQSQAAEAGDQGLPSAVANAAEQGGAEGKREQQQQQPEVAQPAPAPLETPPEAGASAAGAADGSRQDDAAAAALATAAGQEQQTGQPQQLQHAQANPLRNLGSAIDRWRARLNVGTDAPEQQQQQQQQEQRPETVAEQKEGLDRAEAAEYRFLGEQEQQQAGDAQTLAAATLEQATEAAAQQALAEGQSEGAEEDAAAGGQEEEPGEEAMDLDEQQQPEEEPAREVAAGAANWGAGASRRAGLDAGAVEEQNDNAEGEDGQAQEEQGAEQEERRDTAGGSYVAARLQAATLEELPGDEALPPVLSEEEVEAIRSQLDARLKEASEGRSAAHALLPAEAEAHGRAVWQRCEALTAGLVGELTEQLRLILEPTLASRLAGDYRTGKRINMKKVIGYIASHFRKDKIWLRRTRPDKRRYQVGELGVVSFGGGGGAVPLHPLERPFTDADGMRFDQDNTISDRPMVDVVTSLDLMLEGAAQRAGSSSSSSGLQQLVLIIADGRFHEKESLRRAVREAAGRPGVLYAFIVLDNPANSILDMQSVRFAGGKPVFDRYLDSFPFPFYIVLVDRQLSAEEAAATLGPEGDGHITDAEVAGVFPLLPRGVSPGVDGLHYEFYQHFWGGLGPPLLAAANAALETTPVGRDDLQPPQ
eukprot:scaffold17.g601.t1